MFRWFKRLLFFVLALLAVAMGAAFAFGDQIADAVVRQAISRVLPVAAARGIVLENVRFSGARVVGPGAIRCDGIVGTARLERDNPLAGASREFLFGADAIVIDAGWPWAIRAQATVIDGFAQAVDKTESGPTGVQVTRIQAGVDFPFSWWRPRATIGTLETEARRVVKDGRTNLPLELTAVASFGVASSRHDLAVRTERMPDGGARIALDRADIERISREYINPLTVTEIDLVARHPHRAATLLRVSEQAARAATALRQRDRNFPHDAYRHVYWSWLLTREFGAAFSEEVTDAHEVGATYEVGTGARRMDLHNNAVGRTYAIAGVAENELISRVLTDPNVMRAPPTGSGGR